MYDSKPISEEHHLKFVEHLKENRSKAYFLVEDLGVIDFIRIDGEFAEIGLYSNPEKFGVGEKLMEAILSFPYKHLYLEVFEENYKAIELYKKFEFEKIETKSKDGKQIVCMELKR
jgi:UDP-4-amino-4,6-dideoxy-N-acetyl-beta-L-altrosamine N-acetyltransferase